MMSSTTAHTCIRLSGGEPFCTACGAASELVLRAPCPHASTAAADVSVSSLVWARGVLDDVVAAFALAHTSPNQNTCRAMNTSSSDSAKHWLVHMEATGANKCTGHTDELKLAMIKWTCKYPKPSSGNAAHMYGVISRMIHMYSARSPVAASGVKLINDTLTEPEIRWMSRYLLSQRASSAMVVGDSGVRDLTRDRPCSMTTPPKLAVAKAALALAQAQYDVAMAEEEEKRIEKEQEEKAREEDEEREKAEKSEKKRKKKEKRKEASAQDSETAAKRWKKE